MPAAGCGFGGGPSGILADTFGGVMGLPPVGVMTPVWGVPPPCGLLFIVGLGAAGFALLIGGV
jgi:hypothetical protein